MPRVTKRQFRQISALKNLLDSMIHSGALKVLAERCDTAGSISDVIDAATIVVNAEFTITTTSNPTPRDVRRALDKKYGKGVIEFYRAHEGYYYFGGGPCHIESFYCHKLSDSYTLEQVLKHVADCIAENQNVWEEED